MAKNTTGADFNFFDEGTVTNTAFEDDETFLAGVRGSSFNFYIRNTGSQNLEYSFNGVHVHGRITSTQDERFFPDRSISKVWFRAPAGSTTYEIEGWVKA